jgi:mRNA interferase MazF
VGRLVKPGDIVVGAFPGAQLTKARPAVVLSTEIYHQFRPDVVVGVITTQAPKPESPTDCELLQWKLAGLHAASYFRLFPITFPQREVRLIGRLADSDWRSVQACLRIGLGGDRSNAPG